MLVLTILIVMIATNCFAVDNLEAVNVVGVAVGQFLTDTIFPILGALALGCVSWAAKVIGRKFKIQSLTDEHNFITNIAAQGIAFAEERAANFAKQNTPVTGSEKLNSAIAYVLQHAPKVSTEQAQSIVTSVLASLPGVGATGSSVVPVMTKLIDPLQVNP